eukprot:gene23408-biopygen14869
MDRTTTFGMSGAGVALTCCGAGMHGATHQPPTPWNHGAWPAPPDPLGSSESPGARLRRRWSVAARGVPD